MIVPNQRDRVFNVPHGSVIAHRHLARKLFFKVGFQRLQGWKFSVANDCCRLVQPSLQGGIHADTNVPCEALFGVLSESLRNFLSLDSAVALSICAFGPLLASFFALLGFFVLLVVFFGPRFAKVCVRPLFLVLLRAIGCVSLVPKRFAPLGLVPFLLVRRAGSTLHKQLCWVLLVRIEIFNGLFLLACPTCSQHPRKRSTCM